MREEIDGVEAKHGQHPEQQPHAEAEVRCDFSDRARDEMMRAKAEQNRGNE